MRLSRFRFGLVAFFCFGVLAACDSSDEPPVLFLSVGSDGIAFSPSDMEHIKLIKSHGYGLDAVRVCWRGDSRERVAEFTGRHVGKQLEIAIAKTVVSTPLLRQKMDTSCAYFSIAPGNDSDALVALLIDD